ncbi:hypothetical protein C8A03DRAFT_29299 [Achaetomium macrosporum]|uniref:Uncharacterized protein n=1 Tax=Achaetomium macrosporum TaxID=79813 RepID=A0AAN7HET4_9PEZI|nr:hypothetical protein C8A03DRAFT_29299 [Achaetomium macrosporum]
MLITGVATPAGLSAIQLARLVRVGRIVATCDAKDMDPKTEEGSLRKWDKARFTVVLDLMGGDTLTRAWKLVAADGKILSVAANALMARPDLVEPRINYLRDFRQVVLKLPDSELPGKLIKELEVYGDEALLRQSDFTDEDVRKAYTEDPDEPEPFEFARWLSTAGSNDPDLPQSIISTERNVPRDLVIRPRGYGEVEQTCSDAAVAGADPKQRLW